jgi:hypothetical protein
MGIKVILSDKEAKSELLAPIPSGMYKLNITDVELRESKSLKNAGKPYYAMECTVAEGTYEGRKVFTNVMLFEGALYSLKQLADAVGIEPDDDGGIDVPEPEWWLGKEVTAKVKIAPKRKVRDEKTGEEKEYDEKNEIAGFRKLGAPGTPNATPGVSSLLPS